METVPSSLRSAIEEFVSVNPDAMITVIDVDEIFRYASTSSLPLFGYKPSEIVGRTLSDFFGALDVAHLKLVLQDAMLNSESVSVSRYVRLKFGGTKCMHGRAHGLYNRQTGQAHILSIGRPCNDY